MGDNSRSIEDIAGQTNLLALNANIEAREGSKHASQSRQTLDEISQTIMQVTSNMEAISDAQANQKHNTENIRQSVVEVKQVANDSIGSAEHLNSIATSTNTLVESLNDTIKSFKLKK